MTRWLVTTAGDHAMTTGTANADSSLLLGEGWRDRIEAGGGERNRGFIEEMLEAELAQGLGRERYVRLKTAPGAPVEAAERLRGEGGTGGGPPAPATRHRHRRR